MVWLLFIIYLFVGAMMMGIDNCVLCNKCREEYVIKATQNVCDLGTGSDTVAMLAMPILFVLWPLAMLMIRVRLNQVIAEAVIMAEEGAG